MAIFVMTDAYVMIGGTDYSDWVKSVQFPINAELLDSTVMGATYRTRVGGLKDWTITVEFLQDFVDNGLDEVLFGLLGTSVALKVRPTSGTISTANPEYQCDGVLESWSPLNNAVGELAGSSAVFRSNGAITRDVSP